MSSDRDDLLRRPLSRYLQDVVAAQPDGRILLFWARLDLVAGLLLMAARWVHPFFPHALPGHVLLFVGMPLLGLAWMARNRPPRPASGPGPARAAAAARQAARARRRDAALQTAIGAFPWWALLASHLAQR